MVYRSDESNKRAKNGELNSPVPPGGMVLTVVARGAGKGVAVVAKKASACRCRVVKQPCRVKTNSRATQEQVNAKRDSAVSPVWQGECGSLKKFGENGQL